MVNIYYLMKIQLLDISVLENFHAAEAFKLINKKENNILENISDKEYRIIRKRIINCILSTDISNHGKHFYKAKSKIESLNIKNGNNIELLVNDDINITYDNQQTIMNLIVHGADISNPCKPLNIYNRWVNLVFEEFFIQGDLEKLYNLPISLNCDRDTINVSKSQIGFINFLVKPTFECLLNIIPQCNDYRINLNNNYEYFKELSDNNNNNK